jgi:hypothetical protein
VLAQQPGGLDAIAAGHPQVHQHDVGAQAAGEAGRRAGGRNPQALASHPAATLVLLPRRHRCHHASGRPGRRRHRRGCAAVLRPALRRRRRHRPHHARLPGDPDRPGSGRVRVGRHRHGRHQRHPHRGGGLPILILTYFPVVIVSGVLFSITEPHWLSTLATYFPAQPLIDQVSTAPRRAVPRRPGHYGPGLLGRRWPRRRHPCFRWQPHRPAQRRPARPGQLS